MVFFVVLGCICLGIILGLGIVWMLRIMLMDGFLVKIVLIFVDWVEVGDILGLGMVWMLGIVLVKVVLVVGSVILVVILVLG